MKTHIKCLLAATLLSAAIGLVHAQVTAFTYQGQLLYNGVAASGTYNLQFSLYTSATGGTAVAGPVTANGVILSNGLFTVTIDFGSGVWNGAADWLQIAAETNGAGSFTTLIPRETLTLVPQSIYALNAGTAATATSAANAASVGGQSAASVASAVIAANASTSLNTPDTIVERDGSGNFFAGSITLSNGLYLPDPGDIFVNGTNAFELTGNLSLGFHNTRPLGGTANVRLGDHSMDSGNSGSYITAVGENALYANTTGSNNTAVGWGTLYANTTGPFNTALGYEALASNTNGDSNTAVGIWALRLNTSGRGNTALGVDALSANTSGSGNTAVGSSADTGQSGDNNTVIGSEALPLCQGDGNTAVGAAALYTCEFGTNNIALGNGAGDGLFVGSDNIYIGNNDGGEENDIIRIGEESLQTNTYIAGIYGASPADAVGVVINSSGQLGTVTNVLTLFQRYPPGVSPPFVPTNGIPVPPGGTLNLTNYGVLSVNGNGDITAFETNGVVTLGDTATAFNTPNSIVKRDGNGNFSASSLTLSSNLNLPFPAIFTSGGKSFLMEEGSLYMGFQNSTYAVQANLYNTAFGDYALAQEATSANSNNGNYNTAVGEFALQYNFIGSYNTANGAYALSTNINGSFNTASGYGALQYNSSGIQNTACGAYALWSNTIGTNNTANGFLALQYNTTGVGNTAVGALALQFNSGGFYNMASGHGALQNNTSGSYDTASGYQALSSNTTGTYNTADGYLALHSNTVGAENTALGIGALQFNTTANYNTAVGGDALYSNTTGSGNTAVGVTALSGNTIGTDNTAVGQNALLGNINGNDNTASGQNALYYNMSGSDNTANGFQALENNTTGNYSTANGYQALYYNTNGNENVASGYRALYNNLDGSYNEAYGDSALFSNTTGSDNVANGYLALQKLTSGVGNIALGAGAGQNLTSGNNNIYIGNPGAGTGFSATENNIIRIGTEGTQTATYLAGTVYANVAPMSDRNAKENFQPVDNQALLAKVVALPVTEWNYKTDSQAVRHIGPMAQDFQAAFGLDGKDDKHISVVDEGGVALAAIQGLNEKVDQKDAEIQSLKQQNESLLQRLQELEDTVKQLAGQK